MYRIGYIDDQPVQYNNFRKKIQRRFPDVDLILLDQCTTREEFLKRIYEEKVDVLLIDYKMASSYGFNGSALINYINDQIRDLECFILTGVERDKVEDGLVAERNRYSKTIFDTEGDDEKKVQKFNEFIEMLIQSANVFRMRRKQKKEQYQELFEKRKRESLTAEEEEEYLRLYKVLASYGMIEELPENVLTVDFEKKLDHLLKIGDSILKKYEKE
ncbi:response regulator [Ruminococcus sp. AF45-4BH]|uniref:response regulator n=1 Tax=Blautia sp. TaxID=1955243 RepID=UPI000E5CF869|nr:response regulator [Ruminococcus sp. AF45-4BH]